MTIGHVYPNLFVVGAPKAGTTTLVYWMRHHPHIFVSTPKEPMYYCAFPGPFAGPDAEALNEQYVSDRASYLDLFAEAGACRYRAEGSTDYLGTPGTASRIHADSPDAKIIIVLRNPITRAFSEHSHLVRDGLESLSFRRSLDAEQARTDAGWNTLFRHVGRGLYHDSVRSYLDVFGADNVMIALYDELHADPVSLRRRMFDFLALEDIELGVPRLNQSGQVRSQLLYDIARGRILPAPAKAFMRKALGRKRISNMQATISNRNLRRLELAQQDADYLSEIFRDDIVALSGLLGQDLQSKWLPT